MDFKKILSNRKFRYGSFATAFTAAFLAIIVLLNVILSVVVEKFPINIDLTENSVFMLTDDSIDYLKTLDKDVTITVLADEKTFTSYGGYYTQAIEVINKYAQYSDRVSVRYVDLVKNPTFTTNYADLELVSYDILVESGSRNKVVRLTDLFNVSTSYYGSYIASSKAEQVMTSAIMGVVSDDLIKVAVATGHEEYSDIGLVDLLEQNNYEIINIDLNAEAIPEDTDMVMIVAPMKDFDEDILAKLDTFLINEENYGKKMFYVADSTQPSLPNLEAFLGEWGIAVEPNVVFETNNARVLYYSPYYALVDYADETFAEKFADKDGRVTLPFSRPLSQVYTERNGFATKVLLQFSETAGILPADAGENYVPTEKDICGPIPGMIMSTKARYVNLEAYESQVIVLGTLSALDEYTLQSTSVTNGEYMINLFNILCEREDVIDIAPKVIGSTELNITAQQAYILLFVFMILLPAVVLITGMVIWLRRRNK